MADNRHTTDIPELVVLKDCGYQEYKSLLAANPDFLSPDKGAQDQAQQKEVRLESRAEERKPRRLKMRRCLIRPFIAMGVSACIAAVMISYYDTAHQMISDWAAEFSVFEPASAKASPRIAGFESGPTSAETFKKRSLAEGADLWLCANGEYTNRPHPGGNCRSVRGHKKAADGHRYITPRKW